MKHERRPSPKPNWRLKKTLARHVEVRAMQPDDLKYLWAAYKKGALAPLGEVFSSADLDQEKFRQAFDMAAEQYSEGWIISAGTRHGFRPIGLVLGALSPLSAYMVIGGIVWFPWASRRNIVEGTVSFFNLIRKSFPWIGYASNAHKRLYEVCCMHGIMRRIGTSYVVFPNEAAAMFEAKLQ